MAYFDDVIDRRGTGSLKWDRFEGRDVLPLWVADMDFRSPSAVIQALHERIDHGVFGYSVAGDRLRAAIVEYLQREHGVAAQPSWIVFLPGMVPALAYAASTIGEPGTSIMVHTPVYPPFLRVHTDTRRELIKVPLACEKGRVPRFEIDFDAMERQVRPDTRLLIFCNPHNPVGRAFDLATVERVAAFCERHDLVLCSDEIHCDLIVEPELRHGTALQLDAGLRQRSITLMAASKTYNIAGLGCSYAVIPDDRLRRTFQRGRNCFVAEVSPLAMVATETAYREGESWRQELLQYLRGNRDAIADFLRDRLPTIGMPNIEATYLALLDVAQLDLQTPVAHFERHGLGFSNGADFDAPQTVRFNFGCPRSVVEEALRRLEAAVHAANTADA